MAQSGNISTLESLTNQEALSVIEQSEALQYQAVISLKQAKGVPTPYDKRLRDVVGRKVRVCFFDMSDLANVVGTSGIRPLNGKIIGNIHEIPVAWTKSEEDIWNFSKASTSTDDYKFIIRTNSPKDDVCLFIEFIVDLTSTSACEMKQKERKHFMKENTSDSSETVEMTCCWAKVPLEKLLSQTTEVIRFDEMLLGGTILNPVDLDEDEISRRRYGWRAIAKALKPYSPPKLSIKSLQISKLGVQERLQISQLPPTIIVPFGALPMLQEYMLIMMSVLSTLATPSSIHTCEPTLRLFPRILDDPETYDIFRNVFNEEMKGPFKTYSDRGRRFSELVLRMWPAFIMPKHRFDEETKHSETKEERMKMLYTMAKGKSGLCDVKETCTPFHVREISFQRLI